jgi:hypothetical protein
MEFILEFYVQHKEKKILDRNDKRFKLKRFVWKKKLKPKEE